MFNRSRAILCIALSLAMAGAAPMVPVWSPRLQTSVSKKCKGGLFSGLSANGTLIGIRASRRLVAHDKRAAVKRRNQLRHKKHARG
jgi:hypothetical protein